MKRPIRISVVIPAYNEERLLGRCLTSLKNQKTRVSYELIVVDNNSIDRTAEIAKSFSVRLIRETQPGVVAARQRGLELAKGQIIACADGDSWYPPHWIEQIDALFTLHPTAIACGGPGIPETDPWWANMLIRIMFHIIHFIYHYTGKVVYLGAFNFAFRKDVFLKLGGYHTYLDAGGDEFDALYRLQNIGPVIYTTKLAMYMSTRCYRVGFIRWLFIDTLWDYVANFLLAKMFKRTIIKLQPIRNL